LVACPAGLGLPQALMESVKMLIFTVGVAAGARWHLDGP
jgi:hypothetical protein